MESQCPNCGTTLPRSAPAARGPLTVADVMTADPITIGPEDSLMQALNLMRQKQIRRIPVVVAETLVGLVSAGDLKRAQPSALSDSQEDFDRVMEETPVSRVMVQNLVTTTEDTALIDAARTLQTTKFGGLPVLREGRLVGILTDNDLVRCVVDLLAQEG
jgi:CBS domain-containing protein